MDEYIPMNRESKLVAMLQRGRSLAYMVALGCLITAIPNGFIPYAAANAGIKTKSFLTAVYFGSFLPVLLLCAIGKNLIKGNYILSVLAFLAFLAFSVVLTKYQNNIVGFALRIRNGISGFINKK